MRFFWFFVILMVFSLSIQAENAQSTLTLKNTEVKRIGKTFRFIKHYEQDTAYCIPPNPLCDNLARVPIRKFEDFTVVGEIFQIEDETLIASYDAYKENKNEIIFASNQLPSKLIDLFTVRVTKVNYLINFDKITKNIYFSKTNDFGNNFTIIPFLFVLMGMLLGVRLTLAYARDSDRRFISWFLIFGVFVISLLFMLIEYNIKHNYLEEGAAFSALYLIFGILGLLLAKWDGNLEEFEYGGYKKLSLSVILAIFLIAGMASFLESAFQAGSWIFVVILATIFLYILSSFIDGTQPWVRYVLKIIRKQGIEPA